jgi:hypothetical protein
MLKFCLVFFVSAASATFAFAYNAPESETFDGPYSTAMDNFNPTASDAGIPGFVGTDGRGVCPPGENDEVPSVETANYVNPVFVQWSSVCLNYIPAPAADANYIGREMYAPYKGVPAMWRLPNESLGQVTGDNFLVCVLGDLFMSQIKVLNPSNPRYASNRILAETDPYKIQPGHITLSFSQPIHNGPGPDFSVFENGFISAGGAGVNGQIFAELGYVEVSTDGTCFARFPSVSLTLPVNQNGLTDPNVGGTGAYGTIDPTNAYNLAGKHVNAYGSSWGTPFNLSDLSNDPNVLNGNVNLNNINYVRVVDIPGNGFFKDNATRLINPNTIDHNTGLSGTYYTANHGIHDAWVTWGSGGFDLEAIGVIEQIYGDADSDGDVDFFDFIKLAARWHKYGNWPQGDFDENKFIDMRDLMLLSQNWLYKYSPEE